MILQNKFLTFAQNYKIKVLTPKMLFEKLQKPKTHLQVDDLTPDGKKALWAVMMSHGASQGFAYDRFFKEGFQAWELLGIDNIKRDFINTHKDDIFPKGVTPDVPLIINEPGGFYRALGMNFGMKKVFTEYMNRLGMGANSVLYKFSSDDWKEYERIGINAIIKDFEKVYGSPHEQEAVTA